MKIYLIFVKLNFNFIMPSRLSTLRSAKNHNNSASTPKPKTKPKAPPISSQRQTVIQRRKKQVTKNLLQRTHLNGKSKKQRRLALEKLRKKTLVSEKFECIQLYANSRNLLQSPSRNKRKEDANFVKKFFKKNNSTKNISKGLRTSRRVLPVPKNMSIDSDIESEEDNPQATPEETAKILQSLGWESRVINPFNRH